MSRLPRRTPLKPGAPLSRSGLRAGHPPARRTRLRPVSPSGPPKQYAKARRWVESRAGGRCEVKVDGVCWGRGAHAHHLKPRSAGRDDSMGNLVWTCLPCHEYIHANRAWSYDHGWLRRRGAS